MSILLNLAKAAAAAVATPVALAVDIVSCPASSMDTDRPVWGRTSAALRRISDRAGDAFEEATQPGKEKR